MNLMHIEPSCNLALCWYTLYHVDNNDNPAEMCSKISPFRIVGNTYCILSLLCTSPFFSPFANKYKGVSWTLPESINIVSISDRGKITPPEIVRPEFLS